MTTQIGIYCILQSNSTFEYSNHCYGEYACRRNFGDSTGQHETKKKLGHKINRFSNGLITE